MTVVVRANPASLSGTIIDPISTADASGTKQSFDIALISDLWTENGIVPIRHAHSKDGRFTANGIPPGRYTAVATTSLDPHLWEIGKFVREMESRGVAVDLAENDQKQVVVPFLALEDVDQIQSRLGIN